MNKKFKIYRLGIISMILVIFSSCNDLDLAPTNKFTDANYWTSPEKAVAVLNMAYGQMLDKDALNYKDNNGTYYFSYETLSDNIYEGRGNSNEKIITSGQADAALGRFSGEWKDSYATIKTCNIFLENVDRTPNMGETLKLRMKAEARFIRAFEFFRLATWYGDVPLFDHDIPLTEALVISRTPHAEVVDFVRKELNDIAQYLPTKQQYVEADNGRITKGAAMMLLARTYLYENDWTNTASVCEKIINQEYGQYELFGSYEGLFLPDNEYNSEVILDMGYALALRTWSDFYDLMPLSAGGRVNAFAPTQELVNDYVMSNGKGINDSGSGYDESKPYLNRDPRFATTIVYHEYPWKMPDGTIKKIYIKPGSSTGTGSSNLDEYAGPGSNSTGTGYYLRKYFDPTAPTGMAAGLNLILMRYADVLLMYAEAKNELGQMNEEVWNKTIRPIRTRAGFIDPEALTYNATDLKEVIRRERRCELVMEGSRIFDLRRWKTAETVLNGYPHGAKYGDISVDNGYIRLDKRSFNKDRDYLWPVPQSERDINPNLNQNPNY